MDLRYGHDGLCLPGLGTWIFFKNAKALWQVLSDLVPRMVPKVEAQVRLIFADPNGYKLFRKIGTVCIKVFVCLGPLPDTVVWCKPGWGKNVLNVTF